MVSIIIPCYNSQKFIRRCLNSLLDQTDLDIELVLVNDGSTDRTDDIIQEMKPELETKLTRFKYVKQMNSGVGAACNTGFKCITGKYLLLLDSDDVLLPDSVKEQRIWLDSHTDYDTVRTDGWYVREDNEEMIGRLENNSVDHEKRDIFNEVFEGITYVWPGTYMIRMALLDKIYPTREIYPSRNGQNLQFLLLASYFGKVGFINKPLMKYTVRAESLSHFSEGDVMSREIKAIQGYKDIRRYLIENYLKEEEREYWNKQLEILYAKVFTRVGIKHNNLQMAHENYKLASKLSAGERDLNFMIEYYQWKNQLICVLLKIWRRLDMLRRR